MRLLAVAALLAGCANDPSFVYTVEVPSNYVIDGHEGQARVEVVFESYEHARAELSLVVILTHQGTTKRRELALGCGGSELGTPVSESVRFSWNPNDPLGMFIDTRSCAGTDGSIVIVDCGC